MDDLRESHAANPNYTFAGSMTQMEKSSREWHGETGYINKAMLLKFIDNLSLPIFYIAGPAPMVKTMRDMLNEAGVDDDNIRAEEFSGY